MRRLLFILFILLLVKISVAQYGNEWINYSQPYFKFPISKSGIFKIDSATLANNGISVSSVNPQNIQVFIYGKEQYLYIKGESDGVFNTNDYIEFYTDNLAPKLDSMLYWNISNVPNPYKSMFNDTIYAFLTWNNSTTNKRLTIETDTSCAAYTSENYFYTESITEYHTAYNFVGQYLDGVGDPRYTAGEGLGLFIGRGGYQTTTLMTTNVYTTSPLPVQLKFSTSGAGNDNLLLNDHHIKVNMYDFSSTNISVWDTVFKGWQNFTRTFYINSNVLNVATRPVIQLMADCSTSTNTDIGLYIHYFYLKYPIFPDLYNSNAFTVFVNDNISGKTYLNINNVTGGSTNKIIFYDLTNNKRIENQFISGKLKVLIPNSGGEKKCYLTAEDNITNVLALTKVNNGTGYFTDYSVAKDSAFVIITHPSLLSSANQYKAYRQTAVGGSYQVILATTNELYEAFGYGINKHPQSIRNFSKFLIDNMPIKPKYLLLIGKATAPEYAAPSFSENIVPSMGYPPSDVLLTSSLHGTLSIKPEISTGRLAALTNNQVMDYLTKVQQHESTGYENWKKQVLHFAGGVNVSEQSVFLSYLNNYKSIIEDTLFGGNVTTFRKTSSAPIQITMSDSIKNLFNEGAALATFFGHGSTSGFDISIDDPTLYSNAGKYPVFLSNSCLSGNIYNLGNYSVSEEWIFTSQKGAIDFIASSSIGISGYLNIFSTQFYQNVAYTLYGKGIGDNIQLITDNANNSGDAILQLSTMDMNLHGDPSIKLWNNKLPDYAITNADVSFDTQSYPDSIGILVNIKNIGKAIVDSFIVKITRIFPNGDTVTYLKNVKAPYYLLPFKMFIYTDYTRAGGLNKFSVYVDYLNKITESNETNNYTIGTVDLFINSGDIVPVYPYEYAIVPKSNSITLKASTTDPLYPNTAWRFQLDTTDKFTSPINQIVINSPGGVVEWTITLPFRDSTVYYWRVSKDSVLPSDKFLWRESSFQTIGNKHGWGQAHYFQFKKDAYQYVHYNRPQRNFTFANNIISVFCKTAFYGVLSFDQIIYSLNNDIKAVWSCSPNGWTIAVFDSISGAPWASTLPSYSNPSSQIGMYNNCHCDGSRPLYAFDFGLGSYCGTDAAWQTHIENFLNLIPNNNWVLAYSPKSYAGPYNYSPSLINAFHNIGSAQFGVASDTLPMIIFGKKGMIAGQAHEIVAPTAHNYIVLNDSIKTRWNTGFITSTVIGPSSKWRSLHWRVASLDMPKTDTTVIKLVGIKNNGTQDTLAVFTEDSLDVLDLSNYIDATVYPFAKLVAIMKDNINKTAPQLKRWQVIYDEAPECAINPKKAFYLKNDTIQQGDNYIVAYAIENIGTVPFTDSLLVTYSLEKNGLTIPLPNKLKAKPFYPSAIIVDTISVNTTTFTGNTNLWIDVNPPGHTKYQYEQFHFNNVMQLSFNTSRDITNPLLDVTFDGVRILNGDIVSAKPNILMTVKDENKFLLLNDTSDFNVYLKKPGQPSETKLFFAKDIQFIAAANSSNSCKLEYLPTLGDGTYTLRVHATDRSSNKSGVSDYIIGFEVINKPTVTQIMNYPNPFSTSTRFVFTLTGVEVPEQINIQIMTITGKVVKTIRREDLGFIHIGRNITEYAWDGKDDFGDKLANGVYLYKVNVKLHGNKMEINPTEADKFFTKEIGKLVILR